MGHKELTTKYAAQLTESQQRIFALEASVADLESELEKAKASGAQQAGDAGENALLRNQLAERERQIAELNARDIETLHSERCSRGTQDTLQAAELKAANALVANLLDTVQTRSTEVSKWKLEATTNEEAAEAKDLRTKLSSSERLVSSLRKSIDSKNESLTAAGNRITTLEARSEQDTDRVDSLTADFDSLQAEKTFLIKRVGELAIELKATIRPWSLG